MTDAPDKDEITGKTTTGHEWDGIKELNTPLPKWWLHVFYASIAVSFVYFVIFPAWPYFDGSEWKATGGIAGYSQRETVSAEVDAARDGLSGELAAMREASLEEILGEERLRTIAFRAGESHFATNCAGCHGSGAQGFKGFPNLRDDEWIWGGSLEAIAYTIEHGVRWEENADTRISQMPAFGKDQILSDEEIDRVVHYVLSLSGREHDAGAAEAGAEIFANQCSFCHGEDGGGMREVGAPALNDAIWLYGGEEETIRTSVWGARAGVMPAWENRLDPLTIKQLTLYVHLLGGGETVLNEDDVAKRAPAGGPDDVAAGR